MTLDERLEALRRLRGPQPLATDRAAAFEKLNEWKRRRKRLLDEAEAILNRARAARKPDLVGEERVAYGAIMAEVADLEERIATASRRLGLEWPERPDTPVLW